MWYGEARRGKGWDGGDMSDKRGCNCIVAIWSIYDGGVILDRPNGADEERYYDGYTCKYCPECGVKIETADLVSTSSMVSID